MASRTLVYALCSVLACLQATAAEMVNESARQIPVAYNVDVVVVGGGTGAVSAAVTAARDGAKVFLAAPYPYLGDDMTATLRLWLEQGEQPRSPLAKKIFNDRLPTTVDPNRLEFTYQADVPSSRIHKDTNPPSVLTDGQWYDPVRQSVQYERNVNIIADLGKVQDVRKVRLMAFRRPSSSAGSGFDVKQVTVSVSNDKENWRQITVIPNDRPETDRATLATDMHVKTRYVRFFVEMPEQYQRMLLGEIEIVGPEKPQAENKLRTAAPPPRPMHVKKTLDDALLAAGVQYLYSCLVTDVLRDRDGKPCGIVMANRAGRQAVLAKTIIDATPRGIVARLAGAPFRPYLPGRHEFRRVVIGGQPRKAPFMRSRIIEPPFRGPFPNRAGTSSGIFNIIEYTLQLQVDDDSYAAYMRADQQARTLTYHPEQQFTSDVLFEVPPDPMHGQQAASGPWKGVGQLPLGALEPAGVERLLVLGGCADIPRPQAERLLRPLALIELGQRLGHEAARRASRIGQIVGARLPGQPVEQPAADGDVLEFLQGVRPYQKLPTIQQDDRALPVLGRYDVVVIGGGTAGAPAGIGAARRGAKTLVVEYLHGLGGVGTLGAVAGYYWGNRVGFTATVLDGQTKWVVEQKMEWYRQELLKAGADIWFGSIGCGAFVHNRRVIGAVVATPYGRGVVLARTVIDATGNSDIAAAAGADCLYTDASEFAMQGTGLPGRRLGGTYNNTDFTIVDETDMVDCWRVLVYSKDKYPDAFDHGRLIDTRERRRIVGDFTITLADEINERTYPDTVVRAYSNFDTHGYTIDPALLLEHPGKKGIAVNIPYRAMLPKGLDGILVVGLGISAHRDAVPLIRMQPDVQNGGYAAGVAAAMAAEAAVSVREINIKALQQHLVAIGNLPESVLTDRDSYPLSDERIVQAVQLLREGRGASVIMTHRDRAMPLLKEAYAKAQGKDRVVYAKALAILGDDTGLPALIAEVRKADKWDKGWNYRGMGQFGSALSPLDTLIVALGYARNPQAVPVIVEKLKLLDATSEFSHHRAVGLALELIGHRSAAQPLAQLLSKPGMTGHVQLNIEIAKQTGVPGGTTSVQTRRDSLRELLLARALFRCGDYKGLGEKILRQYTRDLRGHLARHARAVLDAGGKHVAARSL